jgi:hypothetical protein
MKRQSNLRKIAYVAGYRSGLEMTIAEDLKAVGIDGEYEQHIINYTKPATQHKYHPDFRLPNGIYVETKGRFLTDDRRKHLLIKEQHPELDIRFLFQNSKTKISKASKTTYADWCIKHGFQFADKVIPEEWLK